ncbi:hypothetical protein AOLI_G00033170 [Acnodon oligacanthus]
MTTRHQPNISENNFRWRLKQKLAPRWKFEDVSRIVDSAKHTTEPKMNEGMICGTVPSQNVSYVYRVIEL